ncbi:MAG: CIA30 family protein [Gammaproteobacteria bacterium]|jgi:hypothetical protein
MTFRNPEERQLLIIDDRRTGDYRSALGTAWRLVTDGIMGGVSAGQLTCDSAQGKACLRLRGEVSLENNGGFVQAALDFGAGGAFDASAFRGVLLEVSGNDEVYNLHLRTTAVRRPWQSYRAAFRAPSGWHSVRLPFAGFRAHRIDPPLDPGQLVRIGIVAIGRAFTADICVAKLALYRDVTPVPDG